MFTKLTISVPVWLDRIFIWPVMVYRRFKYGYTFRRIYLGQNKFTIVDQADFYSLNNYQWCVQQYDRNIYAVRLIMNSSQRMKIVSLHREILNPPKGLLVDHRNNDGLDNRRENLRLATHSQNMFNKRKTLKKTYSHFIGVSFDKSVGKWIASISFQGKHIFLGRFSSEIDAAKARDNAAIKYHKEFARLNFS